MIFQALEKSRGNQGQAAEALGISRRTLIRKLKSYRATGTQPNPLGPLQQRYYRARLEVPVQLKCANELVQGTLLNLSYGGAGIKTEKVLRYGTPVSLSFSIPGSNQAMEMTGRVTWTNRDGQHGIQFSDLPPTLRSVLHNWLSSEMRKDGWEATQ